MSASARSATVDQRALTTIIVRDDTLASLTITEGHVRDEGGVLRQFWGGTAGGGSAPLAATADPSSVNGAASSPPVREVSTNATTVTVTGGVAPFSFAWFNAGTMYANNSTSATTVFSAMLGGGETDSDTFVCTVTDALGNMTQTEPVSAYVNNFGKPLNG